MREKRSVWALAGAAFVSLIALLGLYLGAYYGSLTGVTHVAEEIRPGTVWPRSIPDYRFLPAVSAIVFYPLHQLDRRLRPEVWELPTSM